jgi:hypothetical protein
VSRTKYTYATGGKYVAISTPYTAEYTPYTAECSNPWISRVVEESRVDFHYIFQSRDGLVGIGQQPLIVRLPRTLYTEVQPIKIVIALARDPLGWRRT